MWYSLSLYCLCLVPAIDCVLNPLKIHMLKPNPMVMVLGGVVGAVEQQDQV